MKRLIPCVVLLAACGEEAETSSSEIEAVEAEVELLGSELDTVTDTTDALVESVDAQEAELSALSDELDAATADLADLAESTDAALALMSDDVDLLQSDIDEVRAQLYWDGTADGIAYDSGDVQVGEEAAVERFTDGSTLAVDGGISVVSSRGVEVQHGFHILSGQTEPLEGRDVDEQNGCEVILDEGIDNFVSGRLTVTTGNMDNPYASAVVVDIFHRRGSAPMVTEVYEGTGWNGDYPEDFDVVVSDVGDSPRVEICHDHNAIAWWTFQGVLF